MRPAASTPLFAHCEGELIPEGGGAGPNLVHAARTADSLVDAVGSAVRDVESVGLAVVGVEASDLVSVRDIAERTGRTYGSVRKLATGQRGPGGFPAPESTGQWALYSWAQVSAWLAEHFDSNAGTGHDRQLGRSGSSAPGPGHAR